MAIKVTNKKIGRGSRNISYLGRDFQDFRQNLIEYAKTYFPDSYNDFNETSPGMMFIEMASYVGDVLGYYTDATLKESFIQYASDTKSLFALANMLGYKPKTTSPAVVTISVYQLCKANLIGEIDPKYLLRIQSGMQVTSTSKPEVTFRTIDAVDFNDSTDREISVYSIDSITNKPDYYLVKKKVRAISAVQREISFPFTTPVPFSSVKISDTNFISIESVVDTNGNTWYEVPYLAQEMVYIDYANVPEYDPDLSQFAETVPYILKLLKTSRRFVVRTDEDFTVSLVFGGGASDYADELITPSVKNVGLGLNSSIDKMDESYDPANFLNTKTYGQAPANTTLTVKYLVGGGVGSNVPVGDLTSLTSIVFDDDIIQGITGVDTTTYSFCKASVAVENETPATGGRGFDTIDEIRESALASFAAQNRAVTAKDYQVRSLSMPTKYGAVAKVYAIGDNALNANSPGALLKSTDNLTEFTELVKTLMRENPTGNVTTDRVRESIRQFVDKTSTSGELANPLAINLYTLGYNSDGRLTQLNRAAKENLKTYINEYRILTDGVNIIDGFIINIGVEFEITVFKNYNSREVLLYCIDELKSFFDINKWNFNQPIYLSDIEVILATIEGVESVQNVKIVNK